MTVVEHLGELRTRLIYSAIAFLALSAVAFAFYDLLLDFLRQPLCQTPRRLLGANGCQLQAFAATEGLMVRLKVTAMAGILASSPVWLYQIWAFVTPGLTVREKRYATPFLLSAVALFLVGTAFAYLTLPAALRFLIAIGGEGIAFNFRAAEYLNFVGLVLLAFGAMFELPLLLYFLGLAGVVTVETLRHNRRVAIVVIVGMAALLTPTQDPFTMLALSVPLYALYEVVIVLLAARRKRAKGAPAGSV